MAVQGMSSPDCCWKCFLVIALILLGSEANQVSAQDKAGSHAAETNPPAVVQCRAHVEAALNQYWEHPDKEKPSLLHESDESVETDNPGIHHRNPPIESKEESSEELLPSKDSVEAQQKKDESSHDDNTTEKDAKNPQQEDDSDSHEEKSKEDDESAEVEERRHKNNPHPHHTKKEESADEASKATESAEDESKEQDDSKEDSKSDEDTQEADVKRNPPPSQKASTKVPVQEAKIQKRGAYRTGVGKTEEVSQKKSNSGPASKDDDNTEETRETSDEDDDDDEDEIDKHKVLFIRTRQHIDEILGLDEIGTQVDKEEQKLTQTTLKELKRTYDLAIKPLEAIYKFKDISTRILGDAEIFAKPMLLFLGPWSSGKSSIINYLLGNERTPSALKTGPEPTDTQFTVVSYGEKAEVLSGTELAADWPFSSVQKFGQSFLDHFRGVRVPHRLLQKVTIVDTPGIIENRKQDRGYPFNDVFQWFIDRADAIYIVFDPAKLEIGSELEAIIDQLKGREAQIRFILNKADTIRRTDVLKVTGQLFWNLSPLLGSSEAPIIYTVSLMTKPFHPGAPARFLMEQEKAFLQDLRQTMDRRVENKVSYSRRHAVRVRNHAKMVDCYLATYFRHKSIFSNKKKVAESITENPNQYSIYAGLSSLTNVSRYDLPDPDVYKVFFRLNPLFEFKPLTATCSYFKGCPLDKLDIAIAYDLPELLGKFKKQSNIKPSDWSDEKGR